MTHLAFTAIQLGDLLRRAPDADTFQMPAVLDGTK